MSQLPVAQLRTDQRRTESETVRGETIHGRRGRANGDEYGRANGDEWHSSTNADAVRDVLDAFDDEDCRAILAATAGESLTVSEITDVCDLPQSTAYRKVDTLVDAGLLAESLRIRRSGHHVRTYACGIEDVTLSVDPGSIHVVVREAGTDHDATVAPTVHAD